MTHFCFLLSNSLEKIIEIVVYFIESTEIYKIRNPGRNFVSMRYQQINPLLLTIADKEVRNIEQHNWKRDQRKSK
jgi:hypothetical protein